MMAILGSHSRSQVLLGQLSIADTFVARLKGLLGSSELGAEQGLWICSCNSIHTFFMRYSIDCVFLDRELNICSLVRDVRPGRLVFPIWRAHSVIELSAGQIDRLGLREGEKLYVGT